MVNRPGNVPSHSDAAPWIDRAIAQLEPHAERICLRSDTDFSLTRHFDRWAQQVDFLFGMDCQPPCAATPRRSTRLAGSGWSASRSTRPSPTRLATGSVFSRARKSALSRSANSATSSSTAKTWPSSSTSRGPASAQRAGPMASCFTNRGWGSMKRPGPIWRPQKSGWNGCAVMRTAWSWLCTSVRAGFPSTTGVEVPFPACAAVLLRRTGGAQTALSELCGNRTPPYTVGHRRTLVVFLFARLDSGRDVQVRFNFARLEMKRERGRIHRLRPRLKKPLRLHRNGSSCGYRGRKKDMGHCGSSRHRREGL